LYIVEEFSRSFLIETSGKSFETPFFIPAISSIKANWEYFEYLDLIEMVGYPAFLLSAYDICKLEENEKETLMKRLSNFAEKRNSVFLDNGNYESYWYNDKTWTLNKLRTILDRTHPDFCFSFDVFWDKQKGFEKHYKETITSIAKTAGMQKTGSTIALIHAIPEIFPKVTRRIVDYLNPEIIAIPERELGFGIFERSQTISKIRVELEKTKKLIPIHILGTGNPISILIYTLCGADMYDAIDWSNSFIDPENAQLLHFSHKDLVDCHCKACKMKKVPYNYQAATHNLIFYLEFLDKIRDSIRNEKIDHILEKYLGEKNASKIKKIVELE
jgi:queuine/archaeosine tRNA-ribosyltransferase